MKWHSVEKGVVRESFLNIKRWIDVLTLDLTFGDRSYERVRRRVDTAQCLRRHRKFTIIDKISTCLRWIFNNSDQSPTP
ncbi:hypothetical protein J6590_041689 [Homalodisca vitripennis]|nr:hypothetical protein J6590_041689 [Homalodisca vitripennis]